jgi:hypothetical protein
MAAREPTEASPLLESEDDFQNEHSTSPRSYLFFAVAIAAIIFAIGFSDSLLQAPMISILEDTLCRRYEGTPSSSSSCGHPSVEATVAQLRGIVSVLEAIPGPHLPFLVCYMESLADNVTRVSLRLPIWEACRPEREAYGSASQCGRHGAVSSLVSCCL